MYLNLPVSEKDNIIPRHIMVLAGEPSGDFHGAGLLKQIKRIAPWVRLTGIGGDMMKDQDMDLFFHINNLSAMGITEVLSQLGVIKKAFDVFRRHIITDRPSLLILIDYPGFNLKAAAFAWKQKIPVLYYITPKVWAWNRSRIKKIRKYVNHAALILPFEAALFKKEKISATFVGHPLLDVYERSEINTASFIFRCGRISKTGHAGYTEEMGKQDYQGEMRKEKPGKEKPGKEKSGKEREGKERDEFTIGLLPGSRNAEIVNLLEIMLQAAIMIHKKTGSIKFFLSRADSVNKKKFNSILTKYNHDNLFEVITGHPSKIFEKSDFLVAASGTVTLEAAICGVPMVIIYKMSYISYFLAKIFVRVKYAGLANIIADREIVPELLQNDATPQKISEKVISLLNTEDLSLMRTRLLMVRKMLGKKGASERTAKIALNMLGK